MKKTRHENDKIMKILKKILKCEINSNTSMINTPQWDSLNHIKIINEIEKKYQTKVELSNYMHINSVKNILIFLKKIN